MGAGGIKATSFSPPMGVSVGKKTTSRFSSLPPRSQECPLGRPRSYHCSSTRTPECRRSSCSAPLALG